MDAVCAVSVSEVLSGSLLSSLFEIVSRTMFCRTLKARDMKSLAGVSLVVEGMEGLLLVTFGMFSRVKSGR